MPKRKKIFGESRPIWLTFIGFIVFGLINAVLLRGKDVILFNPKGAVAEQQMDLMITSTLILLVIAIPALFLLYSFAWKYRETNNKAKYDPEPRKSKLLLFGMWLFPILIAGAITAVLIPATYKLEPQKPLNGSTDPLTVQVVALRWKWLFIYPEQNIATVNYVQIPEDTPVEFELTADETPMSSFWIPHLGGMLYAMTEHVNRLNLMAETPGDYEGSAAEINGHGFAGMRFNARVSTKEDFDKWVQETTLSPAELNTAEYEKLLEPSEKHPVAYYANPGPDLYSTILGKYAGSHQHNTGYAEHEGH